MRHFFKTILFLTLTWLALPLHAQKDSAEIARFEAEEKDFIAQEMSDSEVAALQTTTPATTAPTATADDGLAEAKQHYHGWVGWIVDKYIDNMNYTLVGALMTLESSFIPFPSEIVIPPAALVAAEPDGRSNMKVWLIVLIGTLGALLGAYINYFLSLWLGRPIIYKFVDSKWGHALSLSAEKMERAEKYFNDHGVMSTLVGRLIPVIRQLISIPAGLSKMNFGVFSLYTFLGAGIWNCVLGLLGYLAAKAGGMDFIYKYSGLLSKVIIVVFVVVVLFFIVRAIIRKRKSNGQKPQQS